MKRRSPNLKKKCRDCIVAKKVGGCLFGCDRNEPLALELETLIEEGEAGRDPLLEQLQQCPEAFKVGQILEQVLSRDPQPRDRILPPRGMVICPFV
jgi:hypothetical protein